jgi:hypothetical protein
MAPALRDYPTTGATMLSLEQTIRDWTIRRKILTAFAAVLALASILGWEAIRALERMSGLGTEPAMAQQIFRDSRSEILLVLAVTIALGVGLALALARLIADPLTNLGVLA